MEEKIKETFALGIFIFSVATLFIFVFYAFYQSGITGKVVESPENKGEINPDVQQMACTDSDGGKAYSVKGVVNYCESDGCSTKEDSCSGKKLVEWYCRGNEKDYEERGCEVECDGGACVNIVKNYKYVGSSSGGGGGGGSSGAAATTEESSTGQNYDLGTLASEQQLELLKNDNLAFEIAGIDYVLLLSDNTPSQATIVGSGQTFILTVGSDNSIDLNSDGTSEIYLKIVSINIITNKIKLMLRPI